MREGKIEDWSKGYAREKFGYWVRKFKSPARRSAPDDIFAKEGVRPFFVEFKATGKAPTELQLIEHTDMRAAGLEVNVIDSREDFKKLIELKEWEWLKC